MNDSTIAAVVTESVKFTLPTDKAKREELAKAAGFTTIAEARDGLKSKDAAVVAAAKSYVAAVKTSAEVVEGSITYPNAAALKTEEVQELIATVAKGIQYASILVARRKGEGMSDALNVSLSYFDLVGASTEDDDTLDGDAIKEALDSFIKACGFNEATSHLVAVAVRGSKAQMLKVRKYLDKLETAQTKFSSWLADQSDVDLDNAVAWMKQQSKRLAAARATPEIDESLITL